MIYLPLSRGMNGVAVPRQVPPGSKQIFPWQTWQPLRPRLPCRTWLPSQLQLARRSTSGVNYETADVADMAAACATSAIQSPLRSHMR
jgi:hypothetical protein